MRPVLGHPVDVLRQDAPIEKGLRRLARDRRAGHVKDFDGAQPLEPAAAQLRKNVHGMGRDAHDVCGAGLEDPIELRPARGRRVDHQLETRRHHLLYRHGADVMTHRAEAQQDRAARRDASRRPSPGHLPAGCYPSA